MKILIINGPNLNMLGIREPSLYGRQDHGALEAYCRNCCRELAVQFSDRIPDGIDCDIFQSNHEGSLVDRIQQAYFDHADGIVINPAAYTHTSVAILDALKAVSIPAVEVHLTDIQEREPFRRISYAGMACEQHFAGQGFESYRLALTYLVQTYGKGKER